MNTTFNSGLFSQRSSLINSSAIRRVFDLAGQKKDSINLSIGQPDFQIPRKIKAAIKSAIDNNFTGYSPTQGIQSLREKLANKFVHENKLLGPGSGETGAENILVSPGVSAILYLLFAVLVDPGDEIILVDPYFLIYDALGKYFQAKIHYIREDNLLDDLKKTANSKVKFLLYSSPSNPTGKIFTRETLTQIAKILDYHGIWAIADEIYEKFDYEKKHFSLGSVYPKTITLNGFSKAYAMTGLRLGYVFAPNELIDKMATIQQYTFVCAPQPAQKAGEVALDEDISGFITDYKIRRDCIYDLLKDSFDVEKPDGAFYIFPKITGEKKVNSEEFATRAIDKNVLIVPGNIFSQHDGSFRISFATSLENLTTAAKTLIQLI